MTEDRPSRRIAALGAALAIALPTIGCGSDTAQAVSEAATPGTPLGVSPTPRASVGVLEGDTLQQFQRIVTPFLLPDGHLVVPDAGANTIRVFAPDGRFVTAFGRPGEGPGEFASLSRAWARGDTIEASDGRLYRITRFTLDGVVESVAFRGGQGADSPIPGSLGDGWAISGVAAAAMGTRDQIAVHQLSRSGERGGEIGTTEGFLRFNSGQFGGPTPLSPKPLLAAHGGRVYIGESMTPRIRVVDAQGAQIAEIGWQPDPPPPLDATLRAVIDSAVAGQPTDAQAVMREGFATAPPPTGLPVIGGMIVDSEGFVWIRPYDPFVHAYAVGGLSRSGPGGRWLVFAPDGARVAEVEAPADVEPVSITRDALVGIHRDELGVESVQVYALERSAPGARP
jgi:hypothetical protein